MTVKIIQYKWAGKCGPFKITKPCEECNLTTSVLQNMMEKEFKDKKVEFEVKPWLDNIFYCLLRFSWHPPIVMINGRKFHQYNHKNPLFDRKKLGEQVLQKLK